MAPAAASAPWDAVARKDQLFVLVTGANSGIGLGICQCLIDRFLASRPLTSHLVLITTTRSQKKSQQTTEALRRHVLKAARSSESLRARAGPTYTPDSTVARVHLLSVQLDLCKLPSIHHAAHQLVGGLVPRLDSIIFNAGIGGFTGLNWPLLVYSFVTVGIKQSCTWPRFKLADAGHLVDPLTGRSTTVDKAAAEGRTTGELMGETFCANVFGHYVLGHALLPLLRRGDADSRDGVGPGRIIWEGSIETVWDSISLSDFQATRTLAPYESTKRLTDVLSLTVGLPRVRPFSAPYLSAGGLPTDKHVDDKHTAPRMYLSHPGVVVTTLFPLNAFFMFWYRVFMYLSRWMGSPWHPVTAYKGACAPVWLVLEDQQALDDMGAEHSKWGSSCSRSGVTAPKKTEVEGWGWDGRVASNAKGDAGEEGVVSGLLHNAVGRKKGAVDLVPEVREDFEELGAECWKEMERLRLEWEETVDRSQALGKAM